MARLTLIVAAAITLPQRVWAVVWAPVFTASASTVAELEFAEPPHHRLTITVQDNLAIKITNPMATTP